MAALLLGTASCSSDMEPSMGDDMVRFTIELPGNIDSRAISDGTKANKLTVAVYDDQGNELPAIRVTDKEIPHQTTVEFKLVKGQKYSFAFWAQADGAPYSFDTASKKVTVNYENAKSNDEKRDAFYAYRADMTVTGPMSETIYLHRPFAQLNYGASDYQDAIKAGVNATKSAVTVKNAATTFNLATGESTGSAEVTFTQEILPNDPETLTVEDKTYQWMAMNYFLVPNNEATIETSLQLYEDGNANAVRDITVPNVPVQKNHRTNIVGNLFTEDVNFKVIIDERFDQPDYIRDLNRPEVTDGKLMVNGVEFDDLETAIAAANGNIVYMGKGTYDTQITVGDGQTVKLAAGKGLNPDEVVITKQIKATAGATFELDGITVKTTATADARTSAALDFTSATVILKNVVTEGQRGVNIDDGSIVTIDNCSLSGNVGTYQRGVNIMNENNEVNIKNTKITAGWYALNFVGTAKNNKVKVENSEIHGWAAVNLHNSGNEVEINNSEIFTPGKYSGVSNAFAAFVYDGAGNVQPGVATNNVIKVTNSNILVESLGDQPMALLMVKSNDNTFIGRNLSIVGKVPMRNMPFADMWIYYNTEDTFTLDVDETVTGTWNGSAFTGADMLDYLDYLKSLE